MNYSEFQSSLDCEPGVCQTEHWHGLLCGLLSAGRPASVELLQRLIHEVTGTESELDSAQRDTLEKLLLLTDQQLTDEQMAFSPLLPDDDRDLSQRTQALCDWCDTFLYGLSVGGLQTETGLSSETSEFIADLTEISHAEYDGTMTEDDEFHFNELVEYVRVGVMLIRQDLDRGVLMPQKEH